MWYRSFPSLLTDAHEVLAGRLPAGLWSLAGLEKLDLSNCGPEALPEEVGGLVGLLNAHRKLKAVKAGKKRLAQALSLRKPHLGALAGDCEACH